MLASIPMPMVTPQRIAPILLALFALAQPGARPAPRHPDARTCMRSCCMHGAAHGSCAMACLVPRHSKHLSAAGDRCMCAISTSGAPEASVTPMIVHDAPLASMPGMRGALSDPRARGARPDFDSPQPSFEPDLTDPPPRA